MATTQNYFPRKSESAPMIYAYEDKYDPNLKGLLKVGYTTIGVQERVRQQYNIVRPGEPPYRILVEESAMRQDGTAFMDHDVHRMLVKMGCQNIEGEWYRCTPQQVRAAIVAVRERIDVAWNRDKTFGMRPEQKRAVDKTADYFRKPDVYLTSCGTVRCVLAKPLLLTNWHGVWGGSACWY